MEKKYTKYNFHKNTFCIFKEVGYDLVKDIRIDYKSKSGSSYIYTENGVYRIADHWGRASDCRWRLEGLKEIKNQQFSVGYAEWKDFHENDEVSQLFFIDIDFENKKAHFHHKKSKLFEEKYFLRNANEVSKTLRIIHQILKEESWAKYLEYKDIDVIRFEICTSLQCSNDTFLKIKNKYIQK
jgi:hypothetical protein